MKKMNFLFQRCAPLTDPDYKIFDVFIRNDAGVTNRAGRLVLDEEEFSNLKFMLIEGAGRFMEQEVTVEFNDSTSMPGFTEGVNGSSLSATVGVPIQE